jgi:hypothetical protein
MLIPSTRQGDVLKINIKNWKRKRMILGNYKDDEDEGCLLHCKPNQRKSGKIESSAEALRKVMFPIPFPPLEISALKSYRQLVNKC